MNNTSAAEIMDKLKLSVFVSVLLLLFVKIVFS